MFLISILNTLTLVMKMKTMLFLTIVCKSFCFGQIITASNNGNYSDPSTWDCNCVPTDGDSIEINKIVTLDTDIYLTSLGIRVRSSGQLIQDATPRNIWLDGSSKLHNSGTVTVNTLHIGPLASVDNSFKLNCTDSIWNEGYVNSIFTINTPDFNNDVTGYFDINGGVTISNNFNNSGYIYHSGSILVENDFFNCNNSVGNAITDFSGIFCIMGDMNNCVNDSIYGPGVMSINESSNNYGVIAGSGLYKTANGTFTVLGNFSATLGTGTCGGVGINENTTIKMTCFPNPASNQLTVLCDEAGPFKIITITGRVVLEGNLSNKSTHIDISMLEMGMYTMRYKNSKLLFIKE